jgi:predicted O-methyltransferase YrrM
MKAEINDKYRNSNLYICGRFMMYLTYRLRARHRHGRGVHPPFAYGIVNGVVHGDGPDLPGLSLIEDYRRELLKDTGTVRVEDHGAGSRRVRGDERKIRDLVRHTAISARLGRLLARLVRNLGPDTMIELGTGMGISSLYLAMANPGGKLHTCEGSHAVAGLAEDGFARLGVGNIEVHRGRFSDLLPGLLELTGSGFFIFIDGDHRESNLVSYVSRVMAAGREDLVMVMDDIHWSRGMHRAWKSIISMPEVSLSIELFNAGIVFVKKQIQKDHFVVIF